MNHTVRKRLARIVSLALPGTALVIAGLACTVSPSTSGPAGEPLREDKTGVRLFYRMLGSHRNAPLRPVTRTVCIHEGSPRVSATGMARTGFTEYPFRKYPVSYTFAEHYAYFPRFASSCPIDTTRTNFGDILIDHVYEPDLCVWGTSAREFVQTFTATGAELVSITLLVASDPGEFRAALLEGGPGGRQVGPVRSFRSGHSMEWGWARWKAGAAPLDPGRTYGIRLWRVDGRRWTPYLHSTGNVYDGGLLYADGRPLPQSDLGAWIIEEPADVSRAIVEGTDPDGWAHGVGEVTFLPRTPDIRLISVTLSPAREKCRNLIARVWSTEEPPRLLAGPKYNATCARPGRNWEAHFLYASQELEVTPGERYRLEILTAPFEEGQPPEMPSPSDRSLESWDLRARIYGEREPGALPVIHGLHAEVEEGNDLHLSWATPFPCRVLAELERLSPERKHVLVLEPGRTGAVFRGLWPGHDHDLRLTAVGPTGLLWMTPKYRILIPGGPRPEPPPPLYDEHPEGFVPLAPPPDGEPATRKVLRFRKVVELANPDFEEGLEGWQTEPPGIVEARGEQYGIAPVNGRGMAGWSHIAGERREQVFEKSFVYQTAETVPGHAYLLSARLRTSVLNGPRGDTRARLLADPRGGSDFGELNGTQWFWTDGRWLRFEHSFVAEGDSATVAIGFFRWRDLDRASAYTDQVRLYDLGPAARSPAEMAGIPSAEFPARVLTDPRIEAGERVEAHLEAPSGHVITGIGARAAADNVTTIALEVRPLLPDGRLGSEEMLRGGREPDSDLEAFVDLPEGLVATGFGARIAPEWDVKTLVVWARPLGENGTLGEEQEFRVGIEAEGGLEKEVRLQPGRVLTAVGLRCSQNDVAGIRASSARLRSTETGHRTP